MTPRPKSIDEHIRCLAQLTGAPESFILQVRHLFSTKGIPLESDATPYLRALDEAFLREEAIRGRAQRAQRKVSELKASFAEIEQTYHQQVDRLRKVRQKLRDNQQRLTLLHRGSKSSKPVEISVPGDHRSLVTDQQSEILPMVPGPEEVQ